MTTGPNTEEGKAVVAANGIKHGLRSEKIVLPEVESIEEWEDFRDGVLESLQPVGRLEDELANRVAQLAWRLRRGLRAEVEASGEGEKNANDEYVLALYAMFEYVHSFTDQPEPPPPPSQTESAPSNLPAQPALQKIMRYEAQYTRQLFQTMHALQALQDRRNGKAAPLVRIQWH